MEQVLTADESTKWEHQLNKEEKLVATSKRLYVVNSKNTRIAVIFRKAITGCEYKLTDYMLVGYFLVAIGILGGLFLMSSKFGPGLIFTILFVVAGLFALCKEEKITITLAGGSSISLSYRKFFALKFEQQLLHRVKDISALEDM
jgi:hypothetical protein